MSHSDMALPEHLINVPPEEWGRTIVAALRDLYLTVFPTASRRSICLAADRLSNCQRLAPLRLDFVILAEDHPRLHRPGDVRLKLGAQLVYGTDIRTQLPQPAPANYGAFVAAQVQAFLRLLHPGQRIDGPLDFPDPTAEFKGYAQVRRPMWYPAGTRQGTKELVAAVSWAATALLARANGPMVSSRSECVAQVDSHLPPETAAFIREVDEHCRHVWQYQVPAEATGRSHLRALCGRALPYFHA